VSRARTLEDRYRRLLALYRAVHGEEMFGVLMTAAPGQRSPGRAESAALVLGAIRIRLRPGRAAPYRYWQDALAVLIAAILELASFWLWQARPVLADLIVIVTIAGALSGLAAVSSAGRRSALLLLLPAYYVVLSLFLQPPVISPALQTSWAEPLRITLECAPLGVLALAVAVRYARQLRPVGPQPPAIG
jgi:hypothetical protein